MKGVFPCLVFLGTLGLRVSFKKAEKRAQQRGFHAEFKSVKKGITKFTKSC
jgi:hypothetical protein